MGVALVLSIFISVSTHSVFIFINYWLLGVTVYQSLLLPNMVLLEHVQLLLLVNDIHVHVIGMMNKLLTKQVITIINCSQVTAHYNYYGVL